MTTSVENERQALAQLFKYGNKTLMIPMWQLGLGKLINAWPEVVGQILVIQNVGRKSGKVYHTPLNYAMVGEDIYCLAGFGEQADWYRNVMAHPQIEVWLPDGWWEAVAEDVSDSAARLDIYRRVLIASGFAAGAFEGIDPHTMPDDELAKLVEDYKLVRIQRTAARTGPGGPGEYSWVWPVATMALGLLLLLRPKKRR